MIDASPRHRACFYSAMILLLLVCGGCFLKPASPGDSALRVVDLDARESGLDQHFGRYTMLFLWASWCPECVLELGSLNLVQKKLTGKGIKIIAVAVQDELDAVKELPPVQSAAYTVLLDQKNRLKERYPVSELPTAYLLDSNGNSVPLIDPEDNIVKKKVVGFKEWQSAAGIDAIIRSTELK